MVWDVGDDKNKIFEDMWIGKDCFAKCMIHLNTIQQ